MQHGRTRSDSGLGGLPVTVSPREFSEMMGYSERYTQELCAKGTIPAFQTKRGGRWRIPTKAALAACGVEV